MTISAGDGIMRRLPDQRTPMSASGVNAYEKALGQVRKPRSSATFRQIAEKVSFNNCTDAAFLKLLTTLRKWFPDVT